MKKLFLFVAVATLGLTSCSSDDDKGGNGENGGNRTSELKVTIDGVAKTFNTIDVSVEDDYDYIDVTASIDNNPSEIIVFTAEKGATGAGTIYSFSYYKNGNEHNIYATSDTFLTDVVQTNSNGKLKGTFIGKVGNAYWDNDNDELIIEEIELTNGSFDISY